MDSENRRIGSVVSLWRYPVNSMMGEELNASELTERGLLGDRGYALFDPATGKVVSAKNPRKWARMFEFRAAYVDLPRLGQPLPPARIICPDGTTATSDQTDVEPLLSKYLDRSVRIMTSAPERPSLEEYWPNIEGLAHREKVTDEPMPARTFFDLAVLHILTTTTIDRLRQLYPEGRFEVRRFRPNVVVEPAEGALGFVEDAWIGKTLSIGHEVRVKVTGPCARCVMTTLPQGDLPRDPGILRTAAKHHQVNVGVYAAVLHGGIIRRGDRLQAE
ncbi:MAG: MOSC domain-containing protein [Methanobacteriota archaeon]